MDYEDMPSNLNDLRNMIIDPEIEAELKAKMLQLMLEDQDHPIVDRLTQQLAQEKAALENPTSEQ